jgi:multidrug efflux system membrane fusion protein
VRIAKVVQRDVPFNVEAIGNVEAYSSVAIKSRIAGQIREVQVRDGQDVKPGDLLFALDDEPFLEQIRLAEANIARDRAMEKQAEANVARDEAEARTARGQAEPYERLTKLGIVAKEQAEQIRTQSEAAEASLEANRAAIESARAALRADEARLAEAKLQLSYTKIYAPISGRAGFVAVKLGNLVKENDTVSLVTILQIQPIYVTFAVPEQTLNEVRSRLSTGRLPVQAFVEGEEESAVSGVLSSVDNTVDPTTGTIKLKAEFANAGTRLWPGQFVNVRLQLRTEQRALVVPSRAVQTGPEGPFAWFVGPGLTAEVRKLNVTRSQGELAVVAEGLAEGDTVVTDGQLRLTPGAKVQVQEAAP